AAVGWAIAAMLVVILAYDQLLFRPLVAWSAKFRFETTAAATAPDPWMLRLLRRTRLLRWTGDRLTDVAGWLAARRLSLHRRRTRRGAAPSRLVDALWLLMLLAALAWAGNRIARFVAGELAWA